MKLALEEAKKAASLGDVPVGCVIVKDNKVIGRACNRREVTGDPLAHAEMLALRQAAEATGSWRLDGCSVYVTLEPCPMCAGALNQARISRLIFGARDFKAGSAGSIFNLVSDPRLPHRIEVIDGIREEECRRLLSDFFDKRRGGKGGAEKEV